MNYTRNAGRVHQPGHNALKVVTPSSIIRRRDIEPLLVKAEECLRLYERATGIHVSVLDETGHSIPAFVTGDSARFCTLCRTYCKDKSKDWAQDEYPCTVIHQESVIEAQRRGGIYIYSCDMGFTFWVSPLFSSGRSAGALIAGCVLGIEREKCVEKLTALTDGAVSKEAAEHMLADIPEKKHDTIISLAQMLLLCAERISKDADDHSGVVKNGEKQPVPLTAHGEQSGGEEIYPLDKERTLLAALRRGDNDTARKILNEMLESLRKAKPGEFQFLQLRAIELVVLLSRAAARSPRARNASLDTTILDTNSRYLGRIQDTQSIEELTDIMHLIVDRLAGQIFSFQGVRHASALRKAERFIWENYTRKISLKEIASASGLSAPYFSSIFKQEMGESLSGYLNRLRVERAAALLKESDLSLNEISSVCGFEDQSWFSKIFKSHTGISPGKYREQGA
ncbi:MAG: helix-turn-helix domain-containing protein [Treponema sp.]|jgi:AraC-like DNA-binding protein/ligand-binding sensor protein|nr:helix-turn-helix domain-containing protein [Treponema sp.]